MKQNKRLSFSKNGDFWVSAGMLIVTALMIQQIAGIEVSESRMVPYVSLFLIGVSAITLLIHSLFSAENGFTAKSLFLSKKETAVLLLLLLCYFLVGILGFYTSTFLFSLEVSILMTAKLSFKKLLKLILFNFVFIAIIFSVFTYVLVLALPEGLFI